jgi:hypothetical protein
MSEIYLPAEFTESEGLDGHWDIEDVLTEEQEALLDHMVGNRELSRNEAVLATLSLLGTKLDDAELTTL